MTEEAPWERDARKRAETEQAMHDLGAALLRTPPGRLIVWLADRLAARAHRRDGDAAGTIAPNGDDLGSTP